VWWQLLLGLVVTTIALWLVLVAAAWFARPDTTRLSEAFRLLPDIVRLCSRLARDPGLPRAARWRLWLVLGYLAMPIDLIPDVVPVLGYADDVVVVCLGLRSVVRRAGPAVLARHWPGSAGGLYTVLRLVGLSPTAIRIAQLPRLDFSLGPHPTIDDVPRVFHLPPGVTSIGSAPACDLQLDGLARRHAEIRRNEADEYVLVDLSRDRSTRVNGAPVTAHTLRTGMRVQLGGWTMSYYREEYADHGRPYGGRIGGELGHQRAQPRRRGPRGQWSGGRPAPSCRRLVR